MASDHSALTHGKKLRVIVCGGRDYADTATLRCTLFDIHAKTPIGHLWHGNARGADREAARWAQEFPQLGISVHAVPADWTRYGKRAGPLRNQKMLGQGIDLVVAFPGGRGTADMVKRAKAAGVQVIEVAA